MNFISENHWILYYLLVINIITFIIYGLDKLLAIKEKSRIRVSTLLLLAFFFFVFGGYLAMKIFTIGLPLIFLMHVVVIYLVFIH